jgi:hypothetical protein
MNKNNMKWIFFFSIVYGGLAIFTVYQLYELIILKYSHELVEGNIKKIEHHSTGKSSTDWLICSYTYRGQIFNTKIHVSSGIPFFTSISKEYLKGKTIFMLNYEKNIIFPQKNINLEIRRQIFPLLLYIYFL